jgi:hypothetical protein
MVKFNIPDGPIADSRGLTRAITDDDGDFAGNEDRERALLHHLSGLELGPGDLGTIKWLAGWETETVVVICSWLRRKFEQGWEEDHAR